MKESYFFSGAFTPKEKLIEEMAQYIVDNNSTVRKTAFQFGISKSTVHKNLTSALKEINFPLFLETQNILQKNKSERHIRGGMATKKKYIEEKNKKAQKTSVIEQR